MSAKDRFYEVMDSLGLNDYKVYTQIDGITKNMMVKLRQGATNEVSTKILIPFCTKYKDVNANYILTGVGHMFMSEYYKGLAEIGQNTDHDQLYNDIVEAATKYNPKSISDIVIMSREEFERSQELYRGLESLIEKIAIRATSKSEEKNLNIG